MNLDSLLTQIEQAQLARRSPEVDPTYIFKHALVQEAAYASLLKQDRKRLHQRVGEALERRTLRVDQLAEYAAQLAQHFTAAGDDAKALEYSIRAGDIAAQRNASAEARWHYARVLDVLRRLPDNDENRRCRMGALVKQVGVSVFTAEPAVNLARLAEAETLAQEFASADARIQRQLAQIYFWNGFIHLMGNETRETLYDYQKEGELAQASGDDQLAANAAFDTAVVLNFHGRFGAAGPLFEESMELMSKAGKSLDDVGAQQHYGVSLAARGDVAIGLAQAHQGLARAQSQGALEVTYDVLAAIHYISRNFHHMATSRHVVEIAAPLGDAVMVFSGNMLCAWAQSHLGQHQAAIETIAPNRKIAEIFHGRILGIDLLAAVECEAALNAGRIAEAVGMAEQAIALARSLDNLWSEGVAQRVWGQALAFQHQF